MKRLALVASLWGLALMPACSSNSVSPLDRGAECSTDTDCQGNLTCRFDVCVVPDATSRQLGFRVIPPNSSLYRPQVITPAEVDFTEGVTIALRPSIRVEGKLLFRSLDGRLSATGPPGVLSFRREETAYNTLPIQTTIGNDSAYSVLLLPGRYTVSFRPDDPNVPSKVWETREFKLDTDPELSIAQDATRLQGTLRDASMPGMVQVMPIEGAKLVAVAKATGSSTTVSETTQQGEFILGALPFSGVHDLKVSTSDETSETQLTFANAFECEDERCTWNLSDGENLELNILNIIGERKDARFVFIPPGEARPDWTGTVATIRGEFPWGQIRITKPVAASGEVRFPVPPGNYELTVTPPDEFSLSRHLTSLSVDPGNEAREITVPARTQFIASVVDPDGEPLPGATVELQAAESIASTLSATADEYGDVSLPVDLYDFWVTIRPNVANLPPTVRFIRASELETATSFTLRVQEPTALAGEVLGAPDEVNTEWIGIPDVAIQPFEVIENRPVTVGEATTRDDGQFQMIISSVAPEPAP